MSSHKLSVINTDFQRISSLHFHPGGAVLYWSDEILGTIEALDVMSLVKRVLIRGLVEPKQIKFDQKGENIYWMDGATKTIFSAKTDGSDVSEYHVPEVHTSDRISATPKSRSRRDNTMSFAVTKNKFYLFDESDNYLTQRDLVAEKITGQINSKIVQEFRESNRPWGMSGGVNNDLFLALNDNTFAKLSSTENEKNSYNNVDDVVHIAPWWWSRKPRDIGLYDKRLLQSRLKCQN